ncbi:Uncharacterised protein [uncultured archaeon]|nr:Uncharacterised protein [uncultured archaeon]
MFLLPNVSYAILSPMTATRLSFSCRNLPCAMFIAVVFSKTPGSIPSTLAVMFLSLNPMVVLPTRSRATVSTSGTRFTLSTSLSKSFPEVGAAEPPPEMAPPMPPELGMMNMVFEPSAPSCLFICAEKLSPSVRREITAAMPITIPKMVSQLLICLCLRLLNE